MITIQVYTLGLQMLTFSCYPLKCITLRLMLGLNSNVFTRARRIDRGSIQFMFGVWPRAQSSCIDPPVILLLALLLLSSTAQHCISCEPPAKQTCENHEEAAALLSQVLWCLPDSLINAVGRLLPITPIKTSWVVWKRKRFCYSTTQNLCCAKYLI